MTKNVVQRLQTIQQDITSIISIYDFANKPTKNDDDPESQENQSNQELPENNFSECLEDSAFCNPFPNQSYTLFESVKKTSSLVTRPFQSIVSDESMLAANEEVRKWNQRKPGSAPTSTSAIHQSDYTWPWPIGLSSSLSERSGTSTSKASDISSQTLWYECKSCADCEATKSSKEIPENPNQFLVKNNEENKKHKNSKIPLHESGCKFGATRREEYRIFEKQSTDSGKTIALSKKENEDSVSCGSRSFLPISETLYPNESDTPNILTPTSSSAGKVIQELRRERPFDHLVKCPTRVPRAVKQRSPSPDTKKTKQITKPGNSKAKKEDEAANDNNKSPPFLKLPMPYSRPKQEDKLLSDRPEEKKTEREKKLRGQCYNQKIPKVAGEEDQESVENETSVTFSKSTEKLERMKVSKDLALDIAKQLRDKCDELRHFKDETLEKVQKLERENKRLNGEIKAAELSKKKLHQRIEELKNESKTKLTEHEMKTKHVEVENVRLKTKMCEMEKQHNEQLLEKQKEIDHVQRERLHEIRNAVKIRENRPGDIQRLTNEKSDLQAKVEELRELLSQNHFKMEKLEEENRRLQEIQNQIQDSEKNKETEQERNHELETIRQNSKDLEEQVKTLRKSIETFDDVQQKLIKQTMDYQQQMKCGLEEIEKLKNENSKLKTDLENEKDALRIKVKIIEDQQETIKQLKEKSEEVKNLLKKNQSLERILNIEREEKLELEEAVEHLNRRKEELKKKIKYLENDLLLAPQEVVKDLQKTQIVLHELENQVQAKQKEWEFHLQCLIRQKEQACNVAEFATKKLMRTTTEFQKQTEAYKALQSLLAENIKTKDKLQHDVKMCIMQASCTHAFQK